jgi:coenzyme F420-0:L-glutamate ligase/coenzyme F420-1:gamma-L-glutamate ligase
MNMPDKFDELMETVSGRRSIRRYKENSVPEEFIDQLLDAAIWAPSAHNRQPWRFVVMNQANTKERLSDAMGQALARDLENDGIPLTVIEKEVGRSAQRLTTAPVIILLCLTMEDMDDYPDQRRQTNELVMAIQSTAMAGHNMLLAAHTLGLGACWMCAPLFCPEGVIETLGLPARWQPQGLLTVGFPAERRTKERRPRSSFVRYLDRV